MAAEGGFGILEEVSGDAAGYPQVVDAADEHEKGVDGPEGWEIRGRATSRLARFKGVVPGGRMACPLATWGRGWL